MSEKNQHRQYSAVDIQSYLKGEMSKEEMHQIETAALEDPFLADAIEGYQTALAQGSEDSLTAGINKLNEEFSKRVNPPARVVPMPYSPAWQVATAACVLIIISIAFYNNWIKPEQQTNSLAVVEKKDNDSSLPGKQVDENTTSKNFVDTINKINNNPASGNQSSPPREIVQDRIKEKPANQIVKAGPEKMQTVPSSEESRNADIADREGENLEKTKETKKSSAAPSSVDARQKDLASAGNAEPLARRNEQLPQQLNNFSGRVVDQNNKPLANANLQVLPGKGQVSTDEYGSFQFASKDSIADVQVTVPGFEQRNFRLQNNIATNNLVLEPQKETLDEVVVTGHGPQRKKDMTKTTVKIQDAVPEIGWTQYEKYLQENKRPPANNPLMKGEVVISFQIKRPATLSDFKIEKSLSKDYDAEAIRLIKEGPPWKLLKGYRTRITTIVKF